MAFCANCGAQVKDGVKFCSSCGGLVDAAPAQQAPPVQPPQPEQQYQPQQQYQQPQQQYQPPQQQYQQPQQQYQQPQQQYQYQQPVVPGAPMTDEARDAQENKTMAILAYIIFFIPLLAGTHKTSPFVKFHTNQGTVLAIGSVGLSIVLSILSAILTAIFTATFAWGALGLILGLFGLLWSVVGIGITVLCILGIVNAAQGKMKELPVIGKFTIIK